MKKLKTKGLIKTLGAVGLAGILAFGAGIFVGCNKTPDDQTKDPPVIVDPIKPDPSDALNQAKEEYNNLASEIANAQSLRVHTRNHQTQEIIKIEIDGKKMQRTETENNGSSFNDPSFIQTTDGQTFEYTLKEDGYHKQVYTGSMTADITKASVVEMLGDITWTAIHNKALSGTKADQRIVATYNYDAKNLTLMSDEYTVTIDNLNNTQVTLPEVAVDETQKQEFVVSEHIDELMEKLQPSFEILCRRVNNEAALVEVKNIYLTKSNSSQYVNTIGATYVAETEQGSEYLYVAELIIPTQEDITYQKICEQGLQYDRYDASHKKLFDFNISKASQTNLKNCIDILAPFAFGDDYQEKAEWFGVYGSSGAGADGYELVMLSDKTITKIGYGVYNLNATGMYDALNKNFIGKEPTNLHTTWQQTVNEVYELPEDILNLSKLIQEYNKDYEQNR